MTDTIQSISRSLSADVATLNTISHNIANTNTPGFRSERTVPSFQSQVEAGTTTVAYDLSDGALANTSNAFDLALRGKGFFTIERKGEALLSRAGNFRLDAENRLVTAQGDKVLTEAGEIILTEPSVRIDNKGQLWAKDRLLGQLKIVDVADATQLQPVDGAFRYKGQLTQWKGAVQQGAIEHANVDAADESIRLMELTRHVESLQRAISIYDKAMETGINRIGEN
ncbi:MAG: flagellar hook-basal body complex protein [Arenimonas sp.]